MQALLTAEATREGTARAQGRQRSRFALWFLFERERLERDEFTCWASNNVTSCPGR
jgi:hypothetical protein